MIGRNDGRQRKKTDLTRAEQKNATRRKLIDTTIAIIAGEGLLRVTLPKVAEREYALRIGPGLNAMAPARTLSRETSENTPLYGSVSFV
jgi:predicted MarR family transcription regulator